VIVAVHETERPGLEQVITLPRLSQLPWPGEIHADTDSLIEHTCQWALAEGLADEDAVMRLRRGGIMHAGPRLAPRSPAPVARLVCDWTAWLIVIDDVFDDEGSELGRDPELARAAIQDVIGSFRGEQPVRTAGFPAEMTGVSASAADLGRRFREQSPSPDWLPLFLGHAEAHIWSKVSEAENRAAGTFLDVEGYVALRRISSAAYTYTYLAEMAAQVTIPGDVRASGAWGQMLDAAADVWLAIQDICSAAKEVSAGDAGLNLAGVMARCAGTSLQQGVDDAYQWAIRRSTELTDEQGKVAALTRDADQGDMTRYLDALGLLLGGHRDWNFIDNPRYSQVISST
jgi:hypothetical protein